MSSTRKEAVARNGNRLLFDGRITVYECVGIAADIVNCELVRFRDESSILESVDIDGGYKLHGGVSLVERIGHTFGRRSS